MSDIDPQPLGSLAGSIGASMTSRLGNPDSTVAFAMAYGWNPGAEAVLVRREEFFAQADALGFPRSQAEVVLKVQIRRASENGSDGLRGARRRIDQMVQKGYTAVLLRKVLADDELTGQPFSAETILNDLRWMRHRLVMHVATMSRVQQRGLALAAIELAEQLGGEAEGWPLERAMAAVMPYVEGA